MGSYRIEARQTLLMFCLPMISFWARSFQSDTVLSADDITLGTFVSKRRGMNGFYVITLTAGQLSNHRQFDDCRPYSVLCSLTRNRRRWQFICKGTP